MATGSVLIRNYTRHMDAKKKNKINEEFIISLVPLVKRIAIRTKNRIYSELTIDDLFSIAMLAIIEAASKIDDTDKDQFQHYLLKRAKGAIYDELRKDDCLSRSSRDFLEQYQKAQDFLSDTLDREPTYEELANFMKISEEELVDEIRKTETSSFYSLESYFTREDGSSSFDDVVAGNSEIGEDKVGKLDVQADILKSLDRLSFQERLVLSFYYYDELNFKEIALIMNISVGRVSQLHTKAILQLKEMVTKPNQ